MKRELCWNCGMEYCICQVGHQPRSTKKIMETNEHKDCNCCIHHGHQWEIVSSEIMLFGGPKYKMRCEKCGDIKIVKT